MPTDSKLSKPQNTKIIFYDANCALCGGFVACIIRREKANHTVQFRFAPLSGETALSVGLPERSQDGAGSVVLFDSNTVVFKSDAVIEILSALGGLFIGVIVLRVLPRKLRDWMYDLVAERRGAIGGGAKCRLVQPLQDRRFLP